MSYWNSSSGWPSTSNHPGDESDFSSDLQPNYEGYTGYNDNAATEYAGQSSYSGNSISTTSMGSHIYTPNDSQYNSSNMTGYEHQIQDYSTSSGMNSYQSNTGPEAYVDQSFGGSYDQHFQDQNTMSHPFSSAPSTAYGYEDPGPLENTPQQEHRVSSADFRCEYCGREFSKQYELTKHERNHTKPLSCEICHERKAQRKDLDRHYRTEHPSYAQSHNIPEISKKCEDCGLKARSDNLKRHQRNAKHGEYRDGT
ncbi:hypothetical protein F5882DRAFT_523089 [Hyaloscypha sp. PMI_1271]|nr:hypothetical protein F5882DRAFT_523089 [Hyaloscypha sp. PMI_1271]